MHESTRYRILLLLILLGAALVRWVDLNHHALWYDESITLQDVTATGWPPRTPTLIGHDSLARRPESTWRKIVLGNRGEDTPPLYFLVTRTVTGLFGLSDITLRLPSVIFGLAAVGLFWRLARRMLGSTAALTATALFAGHPFLIEYSREGRAYALFLFLAVASLLLFLRILETDTHPRRDFLLWILVNTLLLYTHYFGLFLLAAETVAGLRSPGRVRRMILGPAIATLLFLPGTFPLAAKVLYIGSGTRAHWLQMADGTHFLPGWLTGALTVPKKLILGGAPLDRTVLTMIILAGLGLVTTTLLISGMRQLRDRDRAATRLLLAVLFIPVGLTFLADLLLGMKMITVPRYLVYLTVPFIIFLVEGARGNRWMIPRRLGLGVVALGLLAGTVTFFQTPLKNMDWRAAAGHLAQQTNSADLLVINESQFFTLIGWYLSSPRLMVYQPDSDRLASHLRDHPGIRVAIIPPPAAFHSPPVTQRIIQALAPETSPRQRLDRPLPMEVQSLIDQGALKPLNRERIGWLTVFWYRNLPPDASPHASPAVRLNPLQPFQGNLLQ